MINCPSPAFIRRYALSVLSYCAYLFPLDGKAETFTTLPPPPGVAPGEAHPHYLLELVVNEAAGGRIVPVEFRDGHYIVPTADLLQAGLPADRLSATFTDVSAIPDVKATYDRPRQRLLLSVPARWLPEQSLSLEQGGRRHPGRVSPGALFNYDVYGSRVDRGGVRLAVWNELRAFGDAGHLSVDGVAQRQISGMDSGRSGYLRYDTYWANQSEEHALRWVVGDAVTDALAWSSSVRIGGAQIARDFSVRPDIVTYPLPAFAGQAAVPTTIDMFINGYRTSSNTLQPGPYSLSNMPFINGAGDVVIVTSDAVGRQVVTQLPFYVSSSLLKPGLADYSLAAGALRRGYGVKNADYGPPVASGSYRRGITDWLTLESHAEGAQNLALAGAGSLVKLGRAGVMDGSWTRSRLSGGEGEQYGWGYQYNNRVASVGMRHTWRSRRFGNLALLDNDAFHSPHAAWTLSRGSAQYNASITLNRYGSLGAALIDIRSQGGERTRLWNLSWSKNLWGDASLFVTGSYDRQQQDYSGAISLVFPFSSLASASLSVERDRPGGTAQRLTVSRAMPNDGGISWDASYARQQKEKDYRQATLEWRNRYVETSGGFYGVGGNAIQWGDVSGALVTMDGRLLAANQLDNAFVLVKTGHPDVLVRYENQPAGATDRSGYLLIPNVTAYYPAKYDIDILNIPADLTAATIEQRFAVPRQSGYLLCFPIEPLRAASVILQDGRGQPLPVGTRLLRDDQPEEYVGWEGLAWLENLATDNRLRAITPDGRGCETRLRLPDGKPRALQTYGPLACPLPAEP
ncbi:fimbria/pilus outer membrane usher protein [Acerihabitans arboris]|uniref:Fimbria/pilus outer membrane usher protein n=1 Tax=Acerihabitans arboris TaxID=2691583 RepID=A0A845SQ22_9GAMM|nr:fimbria/pilus outer membrane usher protein [Acerihabitans arboris]NDL64658.1 fimbria/pilus outer membrane usher protein [Acerihabitans arboris]